MSKNNSSIRIAIVQMSMLHEKEKNLDKAAIKIKESASKGADIVCLPELFATRYFPQSENNKYFELAEKIPGPTTEILSQAAKDNKVILIGGSIFEKQETKKFSFGKFFCKYYNTSVIFDKNGRIIGKYRKIHIPHDPGFYEQKYFTAGNKYPIFATSVAKIGILICYDQWYPEAARINALNGAQIIFYPTAIGWTDEMRKNEPFSQKRWERDQCSHASINGVFVAAANRTGREDNLEFWGNSFIADPFGNIVKRASGSGEEILVADIDLSLIEDSREGWRFLQNRRPETYKELLR